MKTLFRSVTVLAISASLFSCKKDNYSQPNSILSGHIVYQGEAIQVERNQVPYQIYQSGFGKVGPVGALSYPGNNVNIATTFAQDGTYSEVLSNGTYKLIIPNGQGPFMWKQTASGTPDSVDITLNGNQTVDLEVTPYYMIRTPQIAVAAGMATATFKVEKIITDANAKDIERVSLYINSKQFVSGNENDHVANTDLAGSAITDPNNISLSVAVPAIVPTQNYVYARIGLKIAGVEDLIFSPLVKLTY